MAASGAPRTRAAIPPRSRSRWPKPDGRARTSSTDGSGPEAGARCSTTSWRPAAHWTPSTTSLRSGTPPGGTLPSGSLPKAPSTPPSGSARSATLRRRPRPGSERALVQELLGGEPDDVPDAYRAADPAARLPLGVAQVLVHGGDDDRVPLSHARDYAERARTADDDCRVVELDGGHFEPIDPRSAAWQHVLDGLEAASTAARPGIRT